MVILDNPVLAFLLGVVLGESLIEQLVIDLPDVIFDNGDVVFCSGRVNIFAQELTVIVRQAVFLADATADCSFFDRDCSFLLNFVGGCGIMCKMNLHLRRLTYMEEIQSKWKLPDDYSKFLQCHCSTH